MKSTISRKSDIRSTFTKQSVKMQSKVSNHESIKHRVKSNKSIKTINFGTVFKGQKEDDKQSDKQSFKQLKKDLEMNEKLKDILTDNNLCPDDSFLDSFQNESRPKRSLSNQDLMVKALTY